MSQGSRESRAGRQRFRLGEAMLLVAGVALGLWLVIPDIQERSNRMSPMPDQVMLGVVAVLGGLSLVGVPLLLHERFRGRARLWGAGKVLWFSGGLAAWLMWPPVVIRRVQGGKYGDSMTGVCFVYGTPLMAVWMVVALLAGGWLRKKHRRRAAARSWRERFGLLLGLAWACTGLYILFLLYSEDLRR